MLAEQYIGCHCAKKNQRSALKVATTCVHLYVLQQLIPVCQYVNAAGMGALQVIGTQHQVHWQLIAANVHCPAPHPLLPTDVVVPDGSSSTPAVH